MSVQSDRSIALGPGPGTAAPFVQNIRQFSTTVGLAADEAKEIESLDGGLVGGTRRLAQGPRITQFDRRRVIKGTSQKRECEQAQQIGCHVDFVFRWRAARCGFGRTIGAAVMDSRRFVCWPESFMVP